MIFPGMDPFLEDVNLWKGLHTSLIVYFRDQLQPLLRPRYLVTIEERVYLEDTVYGRFPDVSIERGKRSPAAAAAVLEADPGLEVQVPELEISEPYLQILDRATKSIVTVIELVSPTNKAGGAGFESYREKQREVRESPAHLVEIDLLCDGKHVLEVPRHVRELRGYRYLASVSRVEGRPGFGMYSCSLQETLPRIAIPLKSGDPDAVLDIQDSLELAYSHAAYEDRIDYTGTCPSTLSPEERSWVRKTLRNAGVKLRSTGRGEA